LFSFCSLTINAQYSKNRFIYNAKDYQQSSKHYSPFVAGAGSCLVPGLGQVYCGEYGRGAAFMGGYVGCQIVFIAGIMTLFTNNKYPANSNAVRSNNSHQNIGIGLAIGGFSVGTVVYVASIFDAIKVAKINSLAYDGKSSTKINFKLHPCVLSNPFNAHKSLGLALNVSF
jgi:hypothetical protein